MSKAKAYDMYVAVEQVITKMETQIKKYKSKLRDKKGARKSPPKMRPVVTEETEGESE
jgi:ribosome-associated translation inhibitor RaiA